MLSLMIKMLSIAKSNPRTAFLNCSRNNFNRVSNRSTNKKWIDLEILHKLMQKEKIHLEEAALEVEINLHELLQRQKCVYKSCLRRTIFLLDLSSAHLILVYNTLNIACRKCQANDSYNLVIVL